MKAFGFVEERLAVGSNVYRARGHEGGDTSHQFRTGGRAALAGDGAPQIGSFGPDLREGKIVLRVRERFSFKGAVRPGETKGSEGPRMVGGGLDAPISVHIGVGRWQEVAPSGARVLICENLRTRGLKQMPGVKAVMGVIAAIKQIPDQWVNCVSGKKLPVLGGITFKIGPEITAPKRLKSVHLKRRRDPDKQGLVEEIGLDRPVMKTGNGHAACSAGHSQ